MKKILTRFLAVVSMLVMSVASAFALNTGPSAPIFDAADVSGLSGNVSLLLIAFIGIGLLFTARKYLGRAGVR